MREHCAVPAHLLKLLWPEQYGMYSYLFFTRFSEGQPEMMSRACHAILYNSVSSPGFGERVIGPFGDQPWKDFESSSILTLRVQKLSDG